MKEYDVIVVGGGPAGVSAAKSVARSGASVLLFEKHPFITSTKVCGEAVSQTTLRTAGVQSKPSIVLRRASARVYAPNMSFVEINQVGYCINKSAFIQEIAMQAADLGAHFEVREEVQHVARRSDSRMLVKTTHGEHTANVVIGADGYNSTVARSLDLTEKSEPITTIQYVMANCDLEQTDSVRFFLGQVAPRGYAWIFPKTDRVAGVGLGARGVPAKEYLDRFVKKFEKELGRGQILDYRGSVVPIGGIINRNVVDGAILIGDAAGTVVPFTGGGIHSSVAAGLLAGEVAAKAAEEGDNSASRLGEFNVKYQTPWARRIKRSLKAMRAVEKMSDHELNLLQEVLSADDIIDLANGMNVRRVATKLLSHPVFAVKLAKALI